MYCIDVLVKEHENISKFLDIVEKECVDILEGKKLNPDFFKRAIYFIRNYADKKHHGKEEDFLFKEMSANLGQAAQKVIQYGMLAEHQMARATVMILEDAIENYEKDPSALNKLHIIANAMSYVYLLRRHIYQENNVVYPLGESKLDGDTLEKVNEDTKNAEDTDKNDWLNLFEELGIDTSNLKKD